MLKVKLFDGNEVVSIKELIATLNELVKLDPVWMQKICLTRYACNHKIKDHESLQAHCYGDANSEYPKAGFIGLLNGLLGIDQRHWGPIAADIGAGGELRGFKLKRWPKGKTDSEPKSKPITKKHKGEKR